MESALEMNATPAVKEEHEESSQSTHHTHPNPDIVELATLILPSHAVNSGLEAGDGDKVVLEASQETVENLASDLEQQSQITAVVDLEVLSELVGVSEEEFIADLHADANEHRVAGEQAEEEPTETAIDNDKQHDEKTALLSTATTSTATTSIEAPTTAVDRVTLPADPFIETLAVALSTTVEETEQDVLAEASSAMLGSRDDQVLPTTTEAAATKTDDDQHLAHDAFLLNIPNETSSGAMEDHFVLALPEILVEASLATETSRLSAGSAIAGHVFQLLEKAMSILPNGELPSDVQAVHLEAHKHLPTKEDPTELHLDLVVKHKVPVIGYVILILGLFSLASVGAAIDLQEGPSPTMKTMWRQMATAAVLLPLVIKSLREEGFPKLTLLQWVQLPLCSIAYAYMTLAFVLALTMTTMANAFVLSNMTSLVIIAGRFVIGLPILRSEGLGAIIGFIGAAICANDASRTLAKAAALLSTDITTTGAGDAMLGNIIALSASFGTALYLIVAKSLRSSMDLFVFMFCVMGFGSCFLILYIVANGENYSWGMHPDHGVFGWLNWIPDRLPLELYMAIVCNCLGTTGYIAVMKYFEPIVPATVMLMEPVVGALLGVAAGTAKLPGIETWLGDVVVAIGTFCVIWSGSKKTEKIDATKALRPTSADDDDASVVSIKKSPYIRRSTAAQRRSIDSHEKSPTKVVWDHT